MARKRYKTEREDYRAGGRVTLARGGRRPAKGKKKKGGDAPTGGEGEQQECK